MNFYDKIHELVKSFKQTNEYVEYIKLKESLKSNPKTYESLKEFRDKQKKHQIEYLNTGNVDKQEQQQLENSYSILIQNNDIKRLFEIEMRLDVFLADMQKIMGDGLSELLEF